MNGRLVLGACVGDCVHVGGVLGFLRLAQSLGYMTYFMGPAVSVERLVAAITERKPTIAAISYRLAPETAGEIFESLREELAKKKIEGVRLFFGGTPPVAERASSSGIFEAVFSGEESRETLIACLAGQKVETRLRDHPQTLLERIDRSGDYPLLRHHLGLETVELTVRAAEEVARSGQLDVLSIAPDQNAQRYFFRPQEMPESGHGAGGVPVRSAADMRAIYDATRHGNHPLLRCYAGTRDLLSWAEMSVATINQAWGAVPLFWYSELDGRSDRKLEEAIEENRSAIAWYAGRCVPIEVNDAHQWSLRNAHDAVAVAVSYIAAYNAKALGVETYVSQYMLNTPPETSPAMDLAKMLAKIDMVEGLHDGRFTTIRQVRTGLRSMPADAGRAKGHLAASIGLAMALSPRIVHVVGYCEADHAAASEEIIESCRIVRGAVELALRGLPGITGDSEVAARREHLTREAGVILEAIRRLGEGAPDPLADPKVLARAVRTGILDAPELYGSGVAPGRVVTAPVDGGCDAVEAGAVMHESKRLARVVRP
jgi:hypothetical protein